MLRLGVEDYVQRFNVTKSPDASEGQSSGGSDDLRQAIPAFIQN